jgi:hypothetical protein
MSLYLDNLTSTGTVQGSPVVPKIYLQMQAAGLTAAYAGNYAVLWTTARQAYSSGNWVVGSSNGRISIPVSGLYSINLWLCLNSASWGGLVVNGNQIVDDFFTNAAANSSGPRMIGVQYQTTVNTDVAVSWTGYLTTNDYFYGWTYSSGLNLTRFNGISVTFLGSVT